MLVNASMVLAPRTVMGLPHGFLLGIATISMLLLSSCVKEQDALKPLTKIAAGCYENNDGTLILEVGIDGKSVLKRAGKTIPFHTSQSQDTTIITAEDSRETLAVCEEGAISSQMPMPLMMPSSLVREQRLQEKWENERKTAIAKAESARQEALRAMREATAGRR